MLNEFRQDPVSGDWVLFSTGRSKKPGGRERIPFYQAQEKCVFEPERMSEQGAPVLIYNNGRKVDDLSAGWTTVVIPNKFPAVKHGKCGPLSQTGPFTVAEGSGFHELVVTRDHEKNFAQFTTEETAEVIRAYKERYHVIAQDECGAYVSIFHNHGRLAGASVYHNHSQILSIPMVPSSILRHMAGARDYFTKTGIRIHQALLDWEIKENKRIVFENQEFVVLCPYVSSSPYQTRIYPKKPSPNFGDITDVEIPLLAEALTTSLKKLSLALDNPDYAYFIHTAPPKKSGMIYDFYQWHIEILPRFSIDAGLELETNVLVNTVDPDEAAELLRSISI